MISSSEISKLETRSSFKSGEFDSTKPVLFVIVDVNDNDAFNFGQLKYRLRLSGPLENGEKITVIIDDMLPYFDFNLRAAQCDMKWAMTPDAIEEDVDARCNTEKCGTAAMREILIGVEQLAKMSDIRPVWQYPLQGFQLHKDLYMRVMFSSLATRSKCLNALHERFASVANPDEQNIFAHDDNAYGRTPSYFNALAREYHFVTAGWNHLRKWSAYRRVDCDGAIIHEFHASIEDIVEAPRPRNAAEEETRMRDRMLIESWDIETESRTDDGAIPTTGSDYAIPTISLVYSYAWSDKPLICFVLSLYSFAPPSDVLLRNAAGMLDRVVFVKCVDERDMIITRARIAYRMQPDMRIAFNGSNFDWKLFNDKATRYDVCGEVMRCMDMGYAPRASGVNSAYAYAFKKMSVKISAENKHECESVSLMAGTLDLDIMVTMRKIYRNEEVGFAQSLNKYLEKAKLPPKNDIYFKAMLRMFQRAHALEDSAIPRKCHCAQLTACKFCSSFAPVREIDCAPVNPDAPMGLWKYHDGRDGGAVILRDERLAKCCACGARPINEEDIMKINVYCAIDSVRPIQLMRKLGVTTDNRELANATFTSLFDAFFRADGMRAVNFVVSLSRDFCIGMPAVAPKRSRATYQGAHVFDPILGIHDRPVTALDFSSLYPSLILAYNISPDMLVTSRANAEMLTEMGYDLHHIEQFEYEESEGDSYTFDGAKKKPAKTADGTDTVPVPKFKAEGWSVRHSGILAPHRVREETPDEERPQTVKYWGDDRPVVGRRALAREHMGLFGAALRFLLDSRKAVRSGPGGMGEIEANIKAIFAKLMTLKPGGAVPFELDMAGLEAQFAKMFAELNGESSPRETKGAYEHAAREISTLELRWKCLNSKQLALKVLANTFYGQMGSYMSVCYTLVGAAGVTAAGRYNITRVAEMLRSKGYTIVYGDTDSVYTRAPESIYAKIDERWRTGEIKTLEEYWGAQVIAAREDMEVLRAQVSAFLRADNGTRFLNMAYEEVGMPAVFFGKKKYVLRPHIKGVTFGARAMVRGLETVKQGRAAIIRTMGNAIIEDILAVRENKDVIQIITERIKEYYSMTRDLSQFVQIKTYKPAKNNVAVRRFVERMHEQYQIALKAEGPQAAAVYMPPEANDKFPCVIVERTADVSHGGHVVKFTIGDKMEYPKIVEMGRAKIDHEYYMTGALMSLFARFISCDPRFAPTGEDIEKYDPAKDYTLYDGYRQDRANKFLAEVCARFNPDAKNPEMMKNARLSQRASVGALCDLICKAAASANIVIDVRVAKLMVHDDIRKICARDGSEPGDDVSDPQIDAIVLLICQVAGERLRDVEMHENEITEKYANLLARQCSPAYLAQRYSAAQFDIMIGTLDVRRKAIVGAIRSDFARAFICMYRQKHIDAVVSGIAKNAAESGTGRSRAGLLPAIAKAIKFDDGAIAMLGKLSKMMVEYSSVNAEMKRESEMRRRFASDCGEKQ
jgi:DNA polymerase elongation subunit (family B)